MTASGDVVVVAIDAPSIEQIGVWPWPRRLHAELLRQARGGRGTATSPSTSISAHHPTRRQTRPSSRRFARPAVRPMLPSFKQPTATWWRDVHFNRPLKPFSNHSWPAVVNVAIESDGLVRRYPFGEKLDDE